MRKSSILNLIFLTLVVSFFGISNPILLSPQTEIAYATTGLTQTQGAGAEGTNSWTNPTNAETATNDGIYATAAPAKNTTVEGIWKTYGFGTLLPTGATITKVEIIPQYKVSTTSSIATLRVQSAINGTNCPSSVSTDTSEPTTDTDLSVDITSCFSPWNESYLNNSALTVTIGAQRGNSTTAVTFSLDMVVIKVTYSTSTFAQSAYNFFNNDNSTGVGSSLGTAPTLASTGLAFRLRTLLHIGDSSLLAPVWTTSTIDAVVPTGVYNSIGIGGDGYPVVSHINNTTKDLKVLHCGNIDCSSGNTSTSVDTTVNANGTSLAIGSDGFPVIAYSGLDYIMYVAKCGNAACSSGNTLTAVDSTVTQNLYAPSIAIGADTYPVISYAKLVSVSPYILVEFYILHCGNTSCSSGNTITTIKTTSGENGFFGQYNAITKGSDGYPVAVFNSYVGSVYSIQVVKCGNAACSSGNSFNSIGSVDIIATDIVKGNDGFPVVSYFDTTNKDYVVVKCGDASCSSGNTSTIVVDLTSGGNAATSIVIGSNTFPVMSYYDSVDADMEILKCGNISCSSGNTLETIASSGSVGINNDVVIGTDNFPVVSYFDTTNSILKFAKTNAQAINLKLQYVGQGTGSCASPTGGTPASYTDVTASTLIAYKNNSTPQNGVALTANGSDPTHNGDSISNQTYVELNNFSASVSSVTAGSDAKFDFALYDNGATASTVYCMRIVKSDDTTLDTYSVYPTLTTAATPPSLTFSISDNSIGFGTLSSSSARYASGDATGSASEVEAHTLAVATNATSGYVVTVKGATLTSANDGSDTITAIGAVNTASSAGSEQFGLRMSASGGNGTVTAPYADIGFAYGADGSTASQVASASSGTGVTTTYSVRYLSNIGTLTEAGVYTATLTYVATANF